MTSQFYFLSVFAFFFRHGKNCLYFHIVRETASFWYLFICQGSETPWQSKLWMEKDGLWMQKEPSKILEMQQRSKPQSADVSKE